MMFGSLSSLPGIPEERRVSIYSALATILHIDRAVGALLAELRHAELPGDRARRLVAVVDAGDDTLELGGLERPVEDQLAGLLRHPAGLHFRSHRAHQLKIVGVGGPRPEQSGKSETDRALHDGEEVVRAG